MFMTVFLARAQKITEPCFPVFPYKRSAEARSDFVERVGQTISLFRGLSSILLLLPFRSGGLVILYALYLLLLIHRTAPAIASHRAH